MRNPLTILLFFMCALAAAQTITNPDLNGTVTGPSCLPAGWQNVPYGDVNCLATEAQKATPDLTDAFGNASGILSNAYSGTTCVTGLYGGTGVVFHEGIQQNVSGFTVGQSYTIYFYQTVVKQNNGVDAMGSWAVYRNNTLVGITPVTHSSASYSSTNHVWEAVSVTFTANSATQLLQFLPYDDDSNHGMSPTDTMGGLRMGIDLISFTNPTGVREDHNVSQAFVYPNPFNQSTQVHFENPGKESCVLTLYNYKGQIVRTVTDIREEEVTLEKNELPTGFYFFVIERSCKLLSRGRLSVE